jgi:hypothetical protein
MTRIDEIKARLAENYNHWLPSGSMVMLQAQAVEDVRWLLERVAALEAIEAENRT